MKKAGKFIKLGIAAVIVLILFFGSIFTVEDKEKAVVTTFGKPQEVPDAGIHFKIPFIQKVRKVNTTVKSLAIGYDLRTEATIESESLMITSDYNFVNVDFYLEYRVNDPISYLYASEDPVTILKNIAQGCIRSVIGKTDVDSVITTGKAEIQSKVKEEIINTLIDKKIGLELVAITIQDAEPPTEAVKEAFKNVETAKQSKETAVYNAMKYQSEQLPAAEAKVDKVKKEALAQKEARINEAKGQTSRFEALYTEYAKFPLVTKQRMFYETMEEILPDMTVYINGDDGQQVDYFLPLAELN